MIDHLSREQVEGFCARSLAVPERTFVSGHLAGCEACLQLFREVRQSRRKYATARINLMPGAWLHEDHLAYEQLVDFVDARMDQEEWALTNLHLHSCTRCRGDVHSFLTDRQAIEPELRIRYAPHKERALTGGWLARWHWPNLHWRPVYAAAVLALLGLGVSAISLFWHGAVRPDQRQQISLTHPDPSPAPSVLATMPNTTATPEASTQAVPNLATTTGRSPQVPVGRMVPGESASLEGRTIWLNDHGGPITLDPAGGITGLNQLAPKLQHVIKEALLAAELGKPEVLTELAGVHGAARGERENLSFRLIFPGGVVLAQNQPTLRWEPLAGATAYRVLVADAANQEVAASGPLPAGTGAWTPPVPLTRGGVYTWVVMATVGDKEITSPPATAPEMKFKLLGDEQVRALERLQRRTKSSLARGVFYAQAGMLAEAEQEFQQLLRQNPMSPLARKLLRSVQSWR